ncbi:MAG: winged helix-turn-helix transcriptional regulator [Chloroflexi bacterium]|nr:winged helix-turn-helix transcriptional regulator [Chloroflexota bacterium]
MTKVESGERRQPQLRTRSKRPSALLGIKNWTLDLDSRQIVTSNGAQKLSPTLCRLLEVFMRNPEKVLDRGFLMKEVWETDYLGDTRTLEVHVCWLRKKIEEDPHRPRYLRTVRGVGYRFGLSG